MTIALLSLFMIASIIAANIWSHKDLAKMMPEEREADKDDVRYEFRIW
jgi:preprotein translocase subunit SecG